MSMFNNKEDPREKNIQFSNSTVEGAMGSEQHCRSARGFRSSQGGGGDVSFSVKPSYVVSERNVSGHTDPISCLKFSPDGKLLASASVDSSVRIWDAVEFKIDKSLIGHKLGLSEVAWSSDSRLLVTASDDKTLKVWDVNSGSCIKTLVGHSNYVFSCDFNIDSTLIVSGSYDCSVRLWTVEGGMCAEVLEGHKEGVTCVRFNPEGTLVVSSSYDKTCRIWNIQTGNCLKYLIAKSAVSFAAFPPKERGCVLFSSLDSVIRVWRYDDAKDKVGSSSISATIVKRFKGHSTSEWCITLNLMTSGEAKWLVSGSENDASIFIWNYETGEMVQKLADEHAGEVLAVACHPTQNIIASADLSDDAFRVWKTYKEV
ncbi:WD repeat-containing protein 5 [Orchesella cincta]|uniref:WD repeat-containing protein 5 n=1 Tax=Orchesella cincta TaxID=48709 RepID=A0A1D2MS19_ORCCI|nr:WD repeat-containing protein 5 [Orchesella cincta]